MGKSELPGSGIRILFRTLSSYSTRAPWMEQASELFWTIRDAAQEMFSCALTIVRTRRCPGR